MPKLDIRIAAFAALAASALNAQSTASVAGSVLQNGLTPLPGATISYVGPGVVQKDSMGRTRYLQPKVIGSAQSRSDGTFIITGLPPDRYTICAYGPSPVHISSCGWNTVDHRVTVASGQNLTGLKLSVNRGALLDITIVDSTGCAARYNKAPVYVFAGALSVQAHPVSVSSGAYHYRALVPQMAPLTVTGNHRCSFEDSGGLLCQFQVYPLPLYRRRAAA